MESSFDIIPKEYWGEGSGPWEVFGPRADGEDGAIAVFYHEEDATHYVSLREEETMSRDPFQIQNEKIDETARAILGALLLKLQGDEDDTFWEKTVAVLTANLPEGAQQAVLDEFLQYKDSFVESFQDADLAAVPNRRSLPVDDFCGLPDDRGSVSMVSPETKTISVSQTEDGTIRCNCSQADTCPLGHTGSAIRCSLEELQSRGVQTSLTR